MSIVGIGAGILAIKRLIGCPVAQEWLPVFLGLAWLTSLTGYLFPFNGFTPAIGTGIVALLILGVVYVAQHWFAMRGWWRVAYVGGVVASVYLLVFVAVAQAFLKIPAVHALAPTQAEPPFAIAQGAVLVVFIVIGIYTVRKHKTARAV